MSKIVAFERVLTPFQSNELYSNYLTIYGILPMRCMTYR